MPAPEDFYSNNEPISEYSYNEVQPQDDDFKAISNYVKTNNDQYDSKFVNDIMHVSILEQDFQISTPSN